MGTLACLSLAIGCAEQTDRGSTLYSQGRLIEAAQAFEHTEYRLRSSSTAERANYGVYRGLTLLALGDCRRAHQWLLYASEVERTAPGALSEADRNKLAEAWAELGRVDERYLNMTPNAIAGRTETPEHRESTGVVKQAVRETPPRDKTQ